MQLKGYTYYFQKLRVGQDIRIFTDKIYLVTDTFPERERYNLTSQLQRAAVSVAANLVEGMSRKTGKEQGHYTSTSFGSLMEVLVLLILAYDRMYLDENTLNEIKEDIDHIAAQLNTLKKKQLADNP